MKQNNHIHFIGICGVAMGALALAFKRAGWQVTGSDKGFFPPVSTRLKEEGINFYPGWHPNLMVKDGKPNLVVVGNVASSTNPEWLYVQQHKLNYKSYPEVVSEYIVKENSIVCAGTFGKSTSTTILAWILSEAGYNPSYMFGALSLNNIPAANIDTSEWSVIEGDEYKSSRWDEGAKFLHYSPTHLLLTSVVWDHADVYPTEKLYQQAFKDLVAKIPASGLAVISQKALDLVSSNVPTELNLVTYGPRSTNHYMYTNVVQDKNGVSFDIKKGNQTYQLSTTCLGEYMADNITGCFAMATEIGIEPEKIITAVKGFKGIKRRLEKRHDEKITVFDDIAHSPGKATGVLESLKKIYGGKIIAVFEPNSGNRQTQAIPGYNNAFAAASEVVVPRLTKIKTAEGETKPFAGKEIAKIIGKTHNQATYHQDDAELVSYLQQKSTSGDVVVFLGSHGFRGMIDELVRQLS